RSHRQLFNQQENAVAALSPAAFAAANPAPTLNRFELSVESLRRKSAMRERFLISIQSSAEKPSIARFPRFDRAEGDGVEARKHFSEFFGKAALLKSFQMLMRFGLLTGVGEQKNGVALPLSQRACRDGRISNDDRATKPLRNNIGSRGPESLTLA